MLREITKMEQRYDAVLMVICDGFSVTEVATKLKVSRQTVYRWMARYEAGGLTALDERSHRPHRSPNQLDDSVSAQVIEWRRLHPSWGPVRLRHELQRTGITPPSHMAVYWALVRSGLVVPHAPRIRLKTYKRWERGRPVELWQFDVVGGVLTDDGTEAKLLTGIDDHSRFVVCCGVMARATLSTRPGVSTFSDVDEAIDRLRAIRGQVDELVWG